VCADLFIVSLLASVTLGLVWAFIGSTDSVVWADVFLAAYLLATTVLFGSIPWSEFSHMFFKPAAAFQKRVEEANGSRHNLPAPSPSPAKLGSPADHRETISLPRSCDWLEEPTVSWLHVFI
jgi:hypothetical protein